MIQNLPILGKPLTSFSLTDTGGKRRTLTSFRGRPVVLCFFCGCQACRQVALQWAQLQRGRTLPKNSLTLIIFQGTSIELKQLVKHAALDLKQTILFSDTTGRVSTDLYHADPCPRLFVLDSSGILRYANFGPDDSPQEAPASLIVAKALDALMSKANQ